MTKEVILKVALQVEGVSHRPEYAESLYVESARLPENCRILDIGGFVGGSSVVFALTVKGRAGLVYTINPGFVSPDKYPDKYKKYPIEGTLHEFIENVTKFGAEGYVIPLLGSSEEVLSRWDGRLFDMVYIDAWHSYEAVKIDIQWLKHTKKNALACFDEFGPGIKEAAFEYFSLHKEWKSNNVPGIVTFQKGEL